MRNVQSVEELVEAYDNGERLFVDCDLDNLLFQNLDLSGIVFKKCFLLCDFISVNFENSLFEKCNLKCATFLGGNLKNAKIKLCSVEGLELKGTAIENLKFEKNYYMGSVMKQDDLLGFLKNNN